MPAVKIDQKIVGYSVVQPKAEEPPAPVVPVEPNIIKMHEDFERPETLRGSTIKLKSASLDHSMYLTINHIVLNEGTAHESVRPFEVFVNTKDPASQPWIVALTRMISAAWRKGGDYAFVIDELKAVHDPRGGCFLGGGVYVPSVAAHIGLAIERHLQEIGAMKAKELSAEAQALIKAKTDALKEQTGGGAVPGAAQCPKCMDVSLVVMDGCSTCLACGYSKCG